MALRFFPRVHHRPRSTAAFAIVLASSMGCQGPRPEASPAIAATRTASTVSSPDHLVVLPIRVVVLRSREWPAANCVDGFETRVPAIVLALNQIWATAGVTFRLEKTTVVEPDMSTVRADLQRLDAATQARPPADLLARAVPLSPRSDPGLTVVFAHRLAVNGAGVGHNVAVVSDSPDLRRVDGGTDDAVSRVVGHMVGAMLGLATARDETNLMAGGTTGTKLDAAQIEAARAMLPFDAVDRSPAAAQFLVVPLHAYVLQSAFGALHASPDLVHKIPTIVAEVNRIWSAAGIYFRLEDAALATVDDDSVRDAFAQLDASAQAKPPLHLLPLVAPTSTRSADGFRIYYLHDFAANGVYPEKGEAFVRETAQLNAVLGGRGEPLARVTAHELGHGLGLSHEKNKSHLMTETTTGTALTPADVQTARLAAQGMVNVKSAEASGVLQEILPLAGRALDSASSE